jgi:preprotein translocase subunit SecA
VGDLAVDEDSADEPNIEAGDVVMDESPSSPAEPHDHSDAARAHDGSPAPHINAKGLGRTPSAKPLVYSSPSLDSSTPEVRVGEASTDNGAPAARRATPRPNPNRGSRGNRGTTANPRRRKP